MIVLLSAYAVMDIDHSSELERQGEMPDFFNIRGTLLKWSWKAPQFDIGCRRRRACLAVPQAFAGMRDGRGTLAAVAQVI